MLSASLCFVRACVGVRDVDQRATQAVDSRCQRGPPLVSASRRGQGREDIQRCGEGVHREGPQRHCKRYLKKKLPEIDQIFGFWLKFDWLKAILFPTKIFKAFFFYFIFGE